MNPLKIRRYARQITLKLLQAQNQPITKVAKSNHANGGENDAERAMEWAVEVLLDMTSKKSSAMMTIFNYPQELQSLFNRIYKNLQIGAQAKPSQ